MNIVIVSDYDGYFEVLAKRIVAYATSPKYKTVTVTAGPFRPDALTVNHVDDDTVNLDFYSAIRASFGSLTEVDLKEAARLL